MNCCADTDPPMAESQVNSAQECRVCQGPSRSVTLKTMLLMLKPNCFDQIGRNQYRFCASSDCPVVYFSGDHSFTAADLRIRVGMKEKAGPIPLCYCFGFYEQDVKDEIENEGRTTIPQRISALVKERMCACEERNPSGACCLGEVTKAVKRLMKEAR